MTKTEQNRAVEKRTQQRLAARKEAAQRGVETRRRNREAREQAPVAPQADQEQGRQAQAADRQTKRPERDVAQKGRAAEAMATVALRGEQAERFRALAAKHELTLAKLLVRMMEVFEAAAK